MTTLTHLSIYLNFHCITLVDGRSIQRFTPAFENTCLHILTLGHYSAYFSGRAPRYYEFRLLGTLDPYLLRTLYLPTLLTTPIHPPFGCATLWTYLLLQWVHSYVCKGIVSYALKGLISVACESPISFFTYQAYPFTQSLPFPLEPFLPLYKASHLAQIFLFLRLLWPAFLLSRCSLYSCLRWRINGFPLPLPLLKKPMPLELLFNLNLGKLDLASENEPFPSFVLRVLPLVPQESPSPFSRALSGKSYAPSASQLHSHVTERIRTHPSYACSY